MAEVRKFRCLARQYSDQMQCACGLAWDMNDPDPPECPQERQYRQMQESEYRESTTRGKGNVSH